MLKFGVPRKANSSPQTLALLAAMLERPRAWRHGYELSKQTGLKSGTLYPLLMRLHEQDCLESRWEEPERPGMPPRHAYKLTPAGLALARALLKPTAAPVLTPRTVKGWA